MAADNRLFVEAVLYLARTGAPWRDLPQALQEDADLEELFMDATIVRAHQHAAGAPKKTVAIKRWDARGGGLTTKKFRRIATRYDKLARRFDAFLHLVSAYIWLL